MVESMHTFPYIQDAGHGWLEVPMKLVTSLGIKVTQYSYRSKDGGTAYLEEDVDAPTLLRALKARDEAFTVQERHVDGDCFVRNLPPFVG